MGRVYIVRRPKRDLCVTSFRFALRDVRDRWTAALGAAVEAKTVVVEGVATAGDAGEPALEGGAIFCFGHLMYRGFSPCSCER